MARKPRIEFPGALYHVIARGNQRRRTFLSSDDYSDYLTRLWSYHNKFHFILYAYCLMPNHLHLLLETGDVPLSKIMQAIQFSYTQSFNRKNKKVGHLFQGRYKAILCQKDEYLLQLIRYIHLNPVRAKMVKDARRYRWSSHRSLLGLEKDAYCDIGAVLGLFGKKRAVAMKRYESFILDLPDAGHRAEYYQLKDQRVLGEDEFVSEAISRKGDGELFFYQVPLSEIIEVVSREWSISLSDICSLRRGRQGSFGREVVVYIAKVVADITMKDVGRFFSKGEAAMAHRYRAIERKLEKDRGLRERVKRLCDSLKANNRLIKFSK